MLNELIRLSDPEPNVFNTAVKSFIKLHVNIVSYTGLLIKPWSLASSGSKRDCLHEKTEFLA